MRESSLQPHIKVLMSTYNGEQFLGKQLESLLEQREVNVELHVRDDGSKDSTLALLDQWRERMPITVSVGRNKGAAASFLEMIYETELNAEYYAFCDQDDYWLPEKLVSAVRLMSDGESCKPLLYYSARSVTDENLNIRFVSESPRRPVDFGNALVQNVATGCTVVVNRALMEQLRSKVVRAENIVMHDWWLLLIAAGLGEVIYDPVPRILYRQHGRNEVGHASGLQFWWRRLKRFAPREKTMQVGVQARTFLELFGAQLSPTNRLLIERCFAGKRNFFLSFGCVSRTKLHRQGMIDNLFLRLLFLLRRI